ncbi:MAG TPA: type V CRISPR-associated protein Cas12k [Kamptonema sp.]|nr:type V CRISPR-associated protein Cas12k [Kamptonema sp.]
MLKPAMSQITIQCRLIAKESTRRQLWELMAQKNTPLINELLERIGQHPDFLTWRQNGKLPPGLIKQLGESLKTDPRYTGQPSRFYMSAIALINYIYKSWFALMKRLQYQLEGKTRWLEMLKSDAELLETSSVTLETLRHQATEILTQLTPQPDSPKPKNTGKKAKKPKASESECATRRLRQRTLSHSLFTAYRQSEDNLTRSAIAYLLKNGCKLTDKEEDPEKFAKRRRRVEIQIQRLTEQLTARMPKGRDLTNAQWLETLAIASTTVPETDTQAKSWQDRLLKQSNAVPFPVTYETNEDLAPKNRLPITILENRS